MCVKLDKTFTESFDMMHEAYDKMKCESNTLSPIYRHIKLVRTSTEDDAKSRRLFTPTDIDDMERMQEVIRANSRLIGREVLLNWIPTQAYLTLFCHVLLPEQNEDWHVKGCYAERMLIQIF